MSARKAKAERYPMPVYLPGATAFDEDPALSDFALIIAAVRSLPEWPELERSCRTYRVDAQREDGERDRRCDEQAGSVLLAYVCFLVDGQVAVRPWWKRRQPEMWRACGFDPAGRLDDPRPTYNFTWRHFAALEQRREHIEHAVASVIGRFAAQDAHVGRYIGVDSTEEDTAAQLVHDCRGDECPLGRAGESLGTFAKAPRVPQVHKLDGSEASERRKALLEAGADHGEGTRHDELAEEVRELLVGDVVDGYIIRGGSRDGWLRFKTSSGHWYATRDTTAGVRSYGVEKRAWKAWSGRYNQKAWCTYWGTPLAITSASCSRPETKILPETLARVRVALGRLPDALVTDAGFTMPGEIERHTRMGIAHVGPVRAQNRPADTDFERVDHTGVAHCKSCGGDMVRVDFSHLGSPTTWNECLVQPYPECRGRQRVPCSANWPLIRPLEFTHPTYQALERSHSRHEAIHDYFRDRYSIAGKCWEQIPKRVSPELSPLRNAISMLIDIVRLGMRNGYMPVPDGFTVKRNLRRPQSRRDMAERGLADLLHQRAELGLDLPYGPAALARGLAEDALTPSQRATRSEREREQTRAARKRGDPPPRP